MANKSKDVKSRPAGKDDMFKIAVLGAENIIEDGKDKLIVDKDNAKQILNSSLELTEGMIIKAYDGGREVETER